MKLDQIHLNLGSPGLPGVGLTDDERKMVRRFDPSEEHMGFFVAKLIKVEHFDFEDIHTINLK